MFRCEYYDSNQHQCQQKNTDFHLFHINIDTATTQQSGIRKLAHGVVEDFCVTADESREKAVCWGGAAAGTSDT